MFKKGDIVEAKKEWLEDHETQLSTRGIVYDYNPEHDKLEIWQKLSSGSKYIFVGRGECYQKVEDVSIECNNENIYHHTDNDKMDEIEF